MKIIIDHYKHYVYNQSKLKKGSATLKDYLLKLPQELHAKLKATSALKGMTMMDFIIEAIKEKIEKEGK
jgi:predicted DNA-binding protein